MPGSILVGASYGLLAVFLVGFVVRSVRLARLPVHLRWELAPIPHEKGRGHYGGSYLEELDWWTKPREKSLAAEARYMLLEIVFLKAVWEHNRGLWWFSFPFHFGLYLLVGAAGVLVLATLGGGLGLAVATGPVVSGFATGLAVAGCGLGLVGAAGLLAKRLTDPRLKDFTSPASLFNLALLAAVCTSGLAAAATADYAATVTGFLGALATANLGVTVPAAPGVHLALTFVFLAYLPFTKMMHFVAKYFTYHDVRWNDEPMTAGSHMEQEVQRLLAQPVSWAGPHVHADGKKSWVEVATEEVGR